MGYKKFITKQDKMGTEAALPLSNQVLPVSFLSLGTASAESGIILT